MNISITKHDIGNESINSVNARDVYLELGIKKDFSSWIKQQIQALFLDENVDYMVYTQKGENLQGGRPSIEYIVTIDTAKHIAMSSRTLKGKEIRDYFLECEKNYHKELEKPKQITKLEALQMAIESEKKLIEANTLLEEQKPKVEYFNALVDKHLLTNFRDTAKELHIKQKDFIKYLLDGGYIYRDQKNSLKPYAKHTPKLFEIKDFKGRWSGKVDTQTLITPKGKETFRLLLSTKGARV